MNTLLQQWDMAVIMLQVAAIGLLLSDGNVVVITMVRHKLPPQKCTKTIIIGTVGATLARMLLLASALYLLPLLRLRIVGVLLLLWVGMRLVSNEKGEGKVGSSASLWCTAITATVADVIVLLDNVLAVATAGRGHAALVIPGVAISIPVIVTDSRLVSVLLIRFLAVMLLGGMFVDQTAGSMLVSDPIIQQLLPAAGDGTARVVSIVGALPVLFGGWHRRPRSQAKEQPRPRRCRPRRHQISTTFLPLQGAFALCFILTPVPRNM